MIIDVNHLSKSFDYYKKELGLKNSLKNLFYREKLTKEAVREISFEIEEGEMVGFLGPNGAGKTTTLKMLSGILHPTGGKASVLGFTPWERKKAFKMQFAIVMGQKNQFWWDLPANESLYLNKCIYEIEDRTYQATLARIDRAAGCERPAQRAGAPPVAGRAHENGIDRRPDPQAQIDLPGRADHRPGYPLTEEDPRVLEILQPGEKGHRHAHQPLHADVEDLCKRSIIINQGRIVYDGDLQRGQRGVCPARKSSNCSFPVPVSQSVLGQLWAWCRNSRTICRHPRGADRRS